MPHSATCALFSGFSVFKQGEVFEHGETWLGLCYREICEGRIQVDCRVESRAKRTQAK